MKRKGRCMEKHHAVYLLYAMNRRARMRHVTRAPDAPAQAHIIHFQGPVPPHHFDWGAVESSVSAAISCRSPRSSASRLSRSS